MALEDSLVHLNATSISRSAAIEEAARRRDLAALVTLAEQAGGFEDNELRQSAWPVLLGCSSTAQPIPSTSTEPGLRRRHGKERAQEPTERIRPTIAATRDLAHHEDEGQVKLDVDRSFVNLLEGDNADVKAQRRQELQDVIVGVLRLHPDLNYFQGFHDIVSVFLLVLDNADATLECVERMSLFRVRDSMGKNIEPVMGYLRLLKRIVRAADPSFADIVEQASNLPYFSLSWILTLLAHDLPDLESTARLFDFLLAHNPGMVAYLAAALVLEKRDAIDALQQDPDLADDPAMLHTTLAKLPTLAPSSVAPSSVAHSRRSSTSSTSLLETASISSLPTDTGYCSDIDVSTPAFRPPTPPPATTPLVPLSVDVLVERTLALWRSHPLDAPVIAVEELLGSNSCIHTVARDLSVEEVEAIVRTGEDVVVPVPTPFPPIIPVRSPPALRLPIAAFLGRSALWAVVAVAGVSIAVAVLGDLEVLSVEAAVRSLRRMWWP